jgi:hypothetical protein
MEIVLEGVGTAIQVWGGGLGEVAGWMCDILKNGKDWSNVIMMIL